MPFFCNDVMLECSGPMVGESQSLAQSAIAPGPLARVLIGGHPAFRRSCSACVKSVSGQ